MIGKRLLGLFVVLAVLAGMAAPLVRPVAVLATVPDTPTNQSPGNGTTDISLTPTLRASSFQDSDNDTFASSEWSIVGGPTFPAGAVTEFTVPEAYHLAYNTVYAWQVRYRDSNSEYSAWSALTSFQTVAGPQAEFHANKTEAKAGESIAFIDDSTGGSGSLSYSWNFGDGDISTLSNPSHFYNAAGAYTVTLTVTDSASGTDTESKLNYITITDPPVAGFTASPTMALVGQNVTFTNGTDGGTPSYSYEWDFNNDGTVDSNDKDPSHAYANPGSYTVTLAVTDSGTPAGTDTETKSNYITVFADLAADFTAVPTTVSLGQAVVFTATATGGVNDLTYRWDFDNNGTMESLTGANPSYTYTTEGTKSVKLVVTDHASNTKTVIKNALITVALGLQADFTVEPAAAAPSQSIMFTSQVNGAVGTAACEWDFNSDGTIDSTEEDPSFAYSEVGTYTVTLKVTDGAGSVTKTKTVSVTATVLAAFSADKTAVTLGQAVKFTNQSGGGTAPYTYEWDFNGDNKVDSTEKDPSYTYPAAGSYAVSLKVKDAAGITDTETKDRYISVGGSIQVDFTASATNAAPGQAIIFTGSVTGGTPPIQYVWDFGDGGTSGDATASHAYATAGAYTVSLKVTDAGGTPATEQKPGFVMVGDVGIAPCAIPAAGGVVQTADGRVSTTFAAGAYDGDATLTILEVSSSVAPEPPEGYTIGSVCFTVEATDGTGRVITSLVRPATITMKYTPADLSAAGKSGGNLKLAYYTTATGKWTIVNTSFNDTNQTLSATTTHFSTWAILVKAPSGGLAWWAKALIVLAGLVVVGVVAWKAFTVKQPEGRWQR